MNGKESERGAALMIVLLLVASLSAIAVALSDTLADGVRRAGAAQARDQAVWALMGAERSAIMILEAQAKQRPGIDLPSEQWLAAPIVVPLEDGVVTARFRDASACFNVNDLLGTSSGADGGDEDDGDEGSSGEADPQAITRFGELVALIGGDTSGGERLATAAADFVDADSDAGLFSAEDSAYSRGELPYLTAGVPFASASEVRAVQGWSRGVYEALRPWLCVRLAATGASDPVPLNINTMAREDAPLLVAALEGLIGLPTAERLIEQRPPDGYKTPEQFFALPIFTQMDPPPGETMISRIATDATLIEFSASVSQRGTEFVLSSQIEQIAPGRYEVTQRRFAPEE